MSCAQQLPAAVTISSQQQLIPASASLWSSVLSTPIWTLTTTLMTSLLPNLWTHRFLSLIS